MKKRSNPFRPHQFLAWGLVAATLTGTARAHEAEPIEFSEIGIPYAWYVELDDRDESETQPAHVGAWSWDEDSFPATAKGWTHTSAWVKLKLTEPARLTLTLESLAGAPWPSPAEPDRLAGTNLFPSFSLYRGWDTDAGVTFDTNGVSIDQDHTFNNRGNIAWAEDVTYLDHLDNAIEHSATRSWLLAAGEYTINLGGNSPVTLAEGRQGYLATFETAPVTNELSGAVLFDVEFTEVGIPYGLALTMDDHASAQTQPDHVGAWSWDEDNFPETAKGWTHTSKWVRLDLLKPSRLTLALESSDGAPWPSPAEPDRLAGTNLFPSFSLYRGWDLDAGVTFDTNGVSIDQDHTFNNRGNIAWAEDVTYLDHLDNSTEHRATRTWLLAAGRYTINLGGNSPVTLAEGRQGYLATFETAPVTNELSGAVLFDVEFTEVGIPYGLALTMDDHASAQTQPDHVGAWSWDEDNLPETAKGWTHTSKWVRLDLLKPSRLTLTLESRDGAPWPSPAEPDRLAGTNLFPSFSLYRGWDLDAGVTFDTNGVSIDQDHTFNNRGNIAWAEDVTYLDHLDNSTEHSATRSWTLPAGRYTINLGGNSPVTLAEGRQGYRATISTTPASSLVSGSATIDYDQAAWNTLASSFGPPPVLTLSGFFDQAAADALTLGELLATPQTGASYTGQRYAMNGPIVSNRLERTTQPTTFAWVAGAPIEHGGAIGLGGVARFATALGPLVYGDFTLQYDAARIVLGGTGWYLKGNIAPSAAAFDLLNVTVTETPGSIRIAGDLGVSFEVANFLYSTPADALKDVGDFNFTGYTVPLTTPALQAVSVAGDNLVVRGINGAPGTACVLVSSPIVTAPASAWTQVGTGLFDENGGCSITVPLEASASARFFRLRQP